MIAVGVTNDVSIEEIQAICSPPHKEDEDYFLAVDFKYLSKLVIDITETTCGNSNGGCINQLKYMINI